MKSRKLDSQILAVVKASRVPDFISALTTGLRSAARIDRTAGRNGPMPGDQQPDGSTSLSDPEALDQLITACHQEMEEEDALQLVLDIGRVFSTSGDLHKAENLYSMVIVQAEASSLQMVVAEALLRRGELNARLNRWRDSTIDLQRSRLIFEKTDNPEAVGRIDNILGTMAVQQGDLRRALGKFQRALETFQRSPHDQMMGTVLMNLGIVHNIIGRYSEALSTYAQAQTYFEAVNDQVKLGSLHHNRGMSFLFQDRLREALRCFNTAYALAARIGNTAVMGLAALGRANVFYRRKNMNAALHHANEAMEHFIIVHDRLSVADTYKMKGMIYRQMKQYDVAESYLLTSLRLNLQLKNRLNAGETYVELGILEQQRGNRGEAVAIWENARACLLQVGARREALRILDLMGISKDHDDEA